MRMKLARPARLMRVSVVPPPGQNRDDANSWLSRATRTPLARRVSAESCAAAQRDMKAFTVAAADLAAAAGAAAVALEAEVAVAAGAETALSRMPLVRMRGAGGSAGWESVRAGAGAAGAAGAAAGVSLELPEET